MLIRTLQQGIGEEPPHYRDSVQGADLAAESPILDWGRPLSAAATPAGGSPETDPHHGDASEDVSMPVHLNARSGPVQAASVQDTLAAAPAGSSNDSPEARLGAPASLRHLLIWQVLAPSPL